MYYSLFRPNVQPYLISFFKIDPQKDISQLNQPVLIIQGDKDIQVSTDDAMLLHKTQPKSVLKIIPNMNHVLKECTTTNQIEQMNTYTNPQIEDKKELIDDIVEFIKGK